MGDNTHCFSQLMIFLGVWCQQDCSNVEDLSKAPVTRYRQAFVSDSFLYQIRLSLTRYLAIRYTFHLLSGTKSALLWKWHKNVSDTLWVPCNQAMQGYPMHFLLRNLIFIMRAEDGTKFDLFSETYNSTRWTSPSFVILHFSLRC